MAKIIILGGGVAGMSAAHELIERGYEVEIYEYNPDYVGGKARSVNYFGKDLQYEKPLPGEHGFRFFPGFYQHVTDTMKRIPFRQENGHIKSVYDNLTPTRTILISRYEQKPIVMLSSFPRSFKDIKFDWKLVSNDQSGLSKEEELFFAERIWQLMTSCKERLQNEYERLGWWEYLRADDFSENYRHLLVEGLTRTLVAAKARTASTKTGGSIFIQLLYCMTDPLVNTDRILCGPTNDKWLNPWKEYLLSKGVVINQAWECSSFETDVKNRAIKSVTLRKLDEKTRLPTGEIKTVSGDYYLMAIPVEKAAQMISDEMVDIDESLAYIKTLADTSVNWMNGIQFYLNENVTINQGHIICSDSEYALTAISQIQFWRSYDIAERGNKKVKGILSVDISDWFNKGLVNNKPADECTKDEIAKEVWSQLKKSLNTDGKVVLRDEMIEDFFLDRDIQEKIPSVFDNSTGLLTNREPLLVNNKNTWDLRPSAHCAINNLFLAADYIRTNTDLATMEGANEAARRAVNCILDTDGSNAQKCKVWKLRDPWYLKLIKRFDKKRQKKGLPWTLHAPLWIEILTFIGGFIYVAHGVILELIFQRKKYNYQ